MNRSKAALRRFESEARAILKEPWAVAQARRLLAEGVTEAEYAAWPGHRNLPEPLVNSVRNALRDLISSQ